jgi:hypothetical protein
MVCEANISVGCSSSFSKVENSSTPEFSQDGIQRLEKARAGLRISLMI